MSRLLLTPVSWQMSVSEKCLDFITGETVLANIVLLTGDIAVEHGQWRNKIKQCFVVLGDNVSFMELRNSCWAIQEYRALNEYLAVFVYKPAVELVPHPFTFSFWVDLIKWVSNVCLSVRSSVRPQKVNSISMIFVM